MGLEDHPGFLGLTSAGVLAIHADWPMYPEEHGADLALLWLTSFPEGTVFEVISDIDRCVLFLAKVATATKDPFDEKNFHVAVWHKDLLELAEVAAIEGIVAVTERVWFRIDRGPYHNVPLYYVLPDGTRKRARLPSLAEYDNVDKDWVAFPNNAIVVTPSGRARLSAILAAPGNGFSSASDRVKAIFSLGYFDAAVREMCIGIERRMKRWLKSTNWGEKLLTEFMARIVKEKKIISSQRKTFKNKIRNAFKFIRNEYMHQFVDIDEIQARAMIFRLSLVEELIDELVADA
jgi:hypothetical protein